jgi:hypothetical protein
MNRDRITRIIIIAAGIWLGVTTSLLLVIALSGAAPNTRAVFLMGSGLVLIWVLICGMLMRVFRDPIARVVRRIGLDWRVKFVLFATLLAMTEELVTTGMTNAAPLFGVPVGAAYITASANYFDVIALHSVVVFIPMFIAWAILLRYIDFHPNEVFLLFGLTGILAEASFGGGQAFAEFALWIFVYGLMVYLPAYSLPAERAARLPKWWHYPVAVILPILFALPVAAVVSTLHPIPIHFPPILPNS